MRRSAILPLYALLLASLYPLAARVGGFLSLVPGLHGILRLGTARSRKGETMSTGIHGYYFEELEPGMSAEFAKTVTEADVVGFAGISGDFNPVHVNEEFAQTTMFKGRIAHGMLSVSFISTVLGTKLPGPGCIYVTQNLKFKAPVRIGDTVTARVEVVSTLPEKKFVTLKTSCTVAGKLVVDGEATLMVPSKA